MKPPTLPQQRIGGATAPSDRHAGANNPAKADPNAHRPGYKPTKVGWIPEEWDVVSLGSLFFFKNGLNKGKEYFGQGSPIVNYVDVFRNRKFTSHDLAGRVTVSSAELRNHGVQEGDVFFTRTSETPNEIGLSAVALGYFCSTVFSGFVLRARPTNNKLDNHFKAYCFSSHAIRREIIFKSSFTTRALTNGRFLSEVPLPLPPLPEQKKIAAILSTWDDAIEQTRDLISAKKQQKKALMQQLLTGKRRLKGFADEWQEQRLGDVFSERNETNGENLSLLAITGQRGIIPASDIDRKDASNVDKSRYKVIRVGDLGYNTMRMWQGVNAISLLEGIVSPAYTIAIPSASLDASFIAHYFKFQPVVHRFYRYSQGLVSDTWNLKFHHFSEIALHFPGITEQRAIAAVLDTADREIAALEAKHNALQQQKKGLMQRLLTGQVRVRAK